MGIIIVVGASGTIGTPILVTETARRMGMDSAGTMSTAETAKAYRVSIDGDMTGQVLDVRDSGRLEG